MESAVYKQSTMGKQNKRNTITGAEGIGTPRPGVEGTVERVPSISSSENRSKGQMATQVYLVKDATGKKEAEPSIFVSVSEGENSDASDWPLLSSLE